MPFVVSLAGYRPAPRGDTLKWTTIRVEESSHYSGPWTLIDTFPIADYPDPTNPPTIGLLTTAKATLSSGWYRLTFVDAIGGVSIAAPEAGSGSGVLLPPSANEIRARSPYLRQAFPDQPLNADVEDRLREAVLDATSIVESLTCRTLSSDLGESKLNRLAFRAVMLKTEGILAVSTAAARKAAVEGGTRLRSFSAGPYSETYFGPEEAGKAGVLDLDPSLHEVLWALATEECKAEWLAKWGGEPEPFNAVRAFNWTERNGRFSRMRNGY